MEKNIKEKIGQLFEQHVDAEQKKAAARAEKAQEIEAFYAEFDARCDQLIVPAFEEFGTEIERSGLFWKTAKVPRAPAHGPMISFQFSSDSQFGGMAPRFGKLEIEAIGTAARTVEYHAQRKNGGTFDSTTEGRHPFASVTAEHIHTALVRILQAVLR